MRRETLRVFFSVACATCLGGVADLGRASELTIHRLCDHRTPPDKALVLAYWSDELAAGGPEPPCVVKDPVFSNYRVISSRVERSAHGAGAVAIVEFEDAARKGIERMTAENRGQILAVVVTGKIVSMPMISRAYSDNRLLITSSRERDAQGIVEAIRAHPQPRP
jgi:preprotein translocase subunit SecD